MNIVAAELCMARAGPAGAGSLVLWRYVLLPGFSVFCGVKAATERLRCSRTLTSPPNHALSARRRTIGKRDLVRNGTLAQISVDPETYQVRVDGEIATCEPARRLPLSQAYYIV